MASGLMQHKALPKARMKREPPFHGPEKSHIKIPLKGVPRKLSKKLVEFIVENSEKPRFLILKTKAGKQVKAILVSEDKLIHVEFVHPENPPLRIFFYDLKGNLVGVQLGYGFTRIK